MAEYTKIETARAIICDFCNQLYSDEPCEPADCDWLRMLEEDAAGVAPVVRCEDCEHAERYERAGGTAGYYCGHPQNTFTYGEYWDRVFKPVKEADDYCSYGERKDDDDAKAD